MAAKDRSLEEGRDASSSLQLLLLPGGWLYSDHDQFFPSPYVAAGHGKTEEENVVVKRASLGLKPGSDPTTPTFADLLQRPEGQRFHFVVDANKYFIAGVLPKMGPSQDALIAVKMLGVLTTDDHDRPEERVASAALLQARLPKFDAPLKFTFQTFFGPKSDKALATAPALWSVLKADRDAWLSFGWLSAGFAGV